MILRWEQGRDTIERLLAERRPERIPRTGNSLTSIWIRLEPTSAPRGRLKARTLSENFSSLMTPRAKHSQHCWSHRAFGQPTMAGTSACMKQ